VCGIALFTMVRRQETVDGPSRGVLGASVATKLWSGPNMARDVALLVPKARDPTKASARIRRHAISLRRRHEQVHSTHHAGRMPLRATYNRREAAKMPSTARTRPSRPFPCSSAHASPMPSPRPRVPTEVACSLSATRATRRGLRRDSKRSATTGGTRK
jgi:hypothetical protein